MSPNWQVGLAIVVALGGVSAAPAQSPSVATVISELTIERDGGLAVVERISLPGDQEAARTIRLRTPAGDQDRVFTIAGEQIDNGGRIERNGDTVTITVRPGESIVSYRVGGAVAEVDGGLEVRWPVAAGWTAAVGTVTATFAAPRPSSSLACFAGPDGSSTGCTSAQVTDTQLTTARQDGLAAGDRMELVVGLPPGTVPANAVLTGAGADAHDGPFALTWPAGLGLLAVLALVMAWFGWLFRARSRDAAALRGSDPGTYRPLMRHGDRVLFASPEGVLPGQIGTVVDGHVDVVDVTATVVDLAVRNYLWLAEESGDWVIVRRNPPDSALRSYERAVYDALPGDVPVGRLGERLAAALPAIRDALYADVVRSGWFARRPGASASPLGRLGLALAAAGVLATVVLAAYTTAALLGVAVVVAGLAVWSGARLLPARTSLGTRLLGRLVALREHLRSVDVHAIPPGDRELVFSRSLPYAVVLGETARWLATFADLDPAADGTPGLYWYSGVADLRELGTRFPAFLTALDGVIAEAGHLRSLAIANP